MTDPNILKSAVVDDQGQRVYRTAAGGYVISEHGRWLPGVYDSVDTAVAAFDADEADLVALRDKVNQDPDPDVAVITGAMLVRVLP